MIQIDLNTITRSRSESEIVLDFSCTSADRLFFNGYQSWTASREVVPTDYFAPIKSFFRTAGRPWGTTRYGDAFFIDYSGKPGCFHGFTYMYRRRGDVYTLFGSTDETNGYTIFYYDAIMGELRITKDAGFTAKYDKDVHVVCFEGTEDEVFDAWFRASGITCRPARPLAGYSSWYNRFDKITDQTITEDLEGCARVLAPGDIFQIDDGWQISVGEWEADPVKFPRGMKASVDDIHERGLLAGLWLAPFSAAAKSSLTAEHPDWLLRHGGKPWYAGCNWGGFYSLDIDNPAVREYLRNVFDKVFNEWGFDLVKLDFLYSAAPWPTSRGSYLGESRGGRMCRAMQYLREWCGDGLILGCGVPLGPA
ncbi:MAG: alpha-galactosidase, partial [Clostridiales bacterium]|nr:alpha-galactosidase [Clostridiales bacterium]